MVTTSGADNTSFSQLEAELGEVKKYNSKLSKQVENMKSKLDEAFEAAERFQNVQSKVVQLSERSR